MKKKFTHRILSKTVMVSLLLSLSACVTQNFENDEPVVENQANRDEMAATRISLGLGYLGMGNMAEAKSNLEKARLFAPNMVQVYTSFAHYYAEVGEHELTIQAYEKALSIKSDDADTLNNYGVYLCRNGELEKAEEQFLKAIAVPTYTLVSQSYENLASCFLQNDHFDKSEKFLTKALKHSPNSSSVLLALVRIEYAMGDYKKAKIYGQKFEKVTRRFTSESLALNYKVSMKLREFKTAKNYGTMLVKMYPQSWEAKQYMVNQLETIEADTLAEKYQLIEAKSAKLMPSSDPKKRVFKLSPNKSRESVAIAQTTPVTKQETVLSSPLVASAPLAFPVALTMQKASLPTPTINSNAPDKVTHATYNTSNAGMSTSESPRLAANTKVHTSPAKDNSVINELIVPKKPEQLAQEKAKKDLELKKEIEDKEAELNDVFLKQAEETANSEKNTKVKTHKVIAGETLYRISIKYNVKIETLRKWNDLSEKNGIRSGQSLFVSKPS